MVQAPILKPIASDKRGASWSLYFPDLDAEMVIIYTNAGYYRGGHSHSRPEVSMLLAGAVSYIKRFPDGREIKFDEKPGDVLHNLEAEVHLSHFTEPSWLIDFKINTKIGECITTNYKPYRDIVDAQSG